ncbi:hypothetical protein F4X88_18895 [Candidatus Poribacteria bacterium]|nr:hypothetical protein [Candidatus Poribacteria bacterium]MYA58357.1 hypothetical protein [Candidatus Poribacteria bacterium]
MLSPIEQFHENITRVQSLGGLHDAFGQLTTPAVDLTDLLRAQIVMIVSALDHYIHEITRVGMLEVYDGTRSQTDAFLRFQVTMGGAIKGISRSSENEWLDIEIRQKHGHQAFQHPDNIANAVRLFSSCELWRSVASELNLTDQDVKNRLRAIVNRRNQIVHEADLDPSISGYLNRWPISSADVTGTLDFIQDICEAIHTVVN